MSQSYKYQSRASFAARHPELRLQMPAALRAQQPVTQPFNDAVNPLRPKERAAQKLTEKQRRDEIPKGSQMVKLDKPLMELKPAFALKQKQLSFNQAWIKEKQEAAMQYLKHQKTELKQDEQENLTTLYYHNTYKP